MKYLLITLFLFFSRELLAQSFEPGIWKTKESIEINTLLLPASSSEECITSDQAKDARAAIAKELKKHGCSIAKWDVKNKKLSATISCKNDEMDAEGKLHGEFSSKSYELNGEAYGTYKQVLPAVAVLSLSGHWVKSCSKK